ncbi:MAG: hypothetical protein AAGG08_00725 [Actinomycetota bacterium]
MSTNRLLRTRWAAIGAAVAVTLGAGTLATVDATTSSGERAVFTAITTCRLVDTRPNGEGGPRTAPLGPAEVFTVTARGAQGECSAAQLPDNAVALALNITALRATQQTFLTVWPDGPLPNGSSLNPAVGQPPTPNAVTTDLSPTGTFNVYNDAGNVDLIVDVVGYYTDHDHDDRYYTEAEVDAAIQAAVDQRLAADSTMVPIARFLIEPAGGAPAGGISAAEVRAPITGAPTASWSTNRYTVDLPGEFFFFRDQQAFCTAIGTQARFVSVSSGGGDLFVYVADIAGAPIEDRVYCTVYADAP